MADDRRQRSDHAGADRALDVGRRRFDLGREAWEHGAEADVRAQDRRSAGAGWPGAVVFCHLSSDICPLIFACSGLGAGVAFERLGPLGCTGCPASTCGLSTWWSTTALDETWF